MTTNRRWLALLAAFMLLFAACNTGGGATTAPSAAPPSVAPVSEAPASVAPSGTPVPESIKIGFVTHVLGNPFIQQIIDGANAAADDLNVELQVTGPEGGDADAQLKAVQTLVAAGVQGIATSVPGESMSSGLNEIIDAGHPGRAVQPARDVGQGAVRRRTVRRERTHPRPEGPREARRREHDRQGHHRQLLPGVPGAREPRQGCPGVAGRRGRHRDPRPIRRQGGGERELRGLGGPPHGEPGRQGPRRPVRPGHREPRQAPGRQCRARRSCPAATT